MLIPRNLHIHDSSIEDDQCDIIVSNFVGGSSSLKQCKDRRRRRGSRWCVASKKGVWASHVIKIWPEYGPERWLSAAIKAGVSPKMSTSSLSRVSVDVPPEILIVGVE